MGKKRKKRRKELDFHLRTFADYVLEATKEEPLTVTEICDVVFPKMDADPNETSVSVYPARIRQLCNRLVDLGEMTVNKQRRVYRYQLIPEVYQQRREEPC